MLHRSSQGGAGASVTVLIPVLNGERWIAECLISLRSQTFKHFDVILIDDGSTDDTIGRAQDVGLNSLTILNGPRKGLAAALAFGVAQSTSEYIARQDSDDLSDPFRLEKQMAYMSAHPKCVLTGSWASVVDGQGRNIGTIKLPSKSKSIKFNLNLSCPFVHSSVLFRRAAAIAAGNYRQIPKDSFAEDYDLWSRMSHLGELHNIPEVLVSYRRNAEGITGTNEAAVKRSGCLIAIRTTQETLDRTLNESERKLIFLSVGRHRRLRLAEVLGVYRIRIQLLLKTHFAMEFSWGYWRLWLSPLSLAFRAPISSTSLQDEC